MQTIFTPISFLPPFHRRSSSPAAASATPNAIRKNSIGRHRKTINTPESTRRTPAICLIFIASLLTGLGMYDKIGKYAGAGSIVPITGFANSVVSPAMEFRREGLVMGVGAKMFTLAGPVLVYGIGSSVLVGLIVLLLGMGG